MPTQDIDSNGAGVEQKQRLSKKGFGKLLWIELAVVTIFLLALGSPYNSRVVNMILFHPEKQLFVDRDALKIFKEKYGVTVSDRSLIDETSMKKSGFGLAIAMIEKPI